MGKYSYHNAKEVLEAVEFYIESGDKFRIRDVYDELSIFDWWPEYLTQAKLKDMRKFLKFAIKHGYTGYVCFKVGATGCANGMWAYKKESTDGYSPKCGCIYKSFTPEYNYWQVSTGVAGSRWLPAFEKYDSITTIKDFEKLLETVNEIVGEV